MYDSVIVVSECAGITMNVLYLNQRFLYMNQSWGFEEKEGVFWMKRGEGFLNERWSTIGIGGFMVIK